MIIIDWGSAEPAAKQISAQLINLIRHGTFLPGDPLPSIREIAEEAGLSTATVKQAYLLLSSAGWIDTRVRRRAMVAHRLPDDAGPPADAPRYANPPYDRANLAEAAHLLGLDVDLWGDSSGQMQGESAVRKKGCRRTTLRQRRWLGQRLRAVVRAALACGMAPDDLRALLQSAIAWENAFTFGGKRDPAGRKDADPPREVMRGPGGEKTPPIPSFLMRKVRSRLLQCERSQIPPLH